MFRRPSKIRIVSFSPSLFLFLFFFSFFKVEVVSFSWPGERLGSVLGSFEGAPRVPAQFSRQIFFVRAQARVCDTYVRMREVSAIFGCSW